MTKLLLNSGADINAKMLDGQTPLACAIFGGQPLSFLENLIKGGANPQDRSVLGQAYLRKRDAKLLKLLGVKSIEIDEK